jgi:regulatory factor X 1/2/3
MVIRDLTLRSAASFGSFHLIRLLYDEYMFYLVEHRVAMACGETSIAVMGEFLHTASQQQQHPLSIKDDADDSQLVTPDSPVGSAGSSSHVHVGITASLAGKGQQQQQQHHHLSQQLTDGSTGSNVKRPKLS